MGLRTKFIDYDARRTPKTDFSCIVCQRDLNPKSKKIRWVHCVDEIMALHPNDETLYVPDAGDRGWFPVGPDCVQVIGLEWTHESAPKT